MTRLPSKVQSGACSSSSTRSLKCVPLARSSSSWVVRKESGLVRVRVVIEFSKLSFYEEPSAESRKLGITVPNQTECASRRPQGIHDDCERPRRIWQTDLSACFRYFFGCPSAAIVPLVARK